VDINVYAIEGTEITYTISGSAGVDGATMLGFPGTLIVTDQNGYYTATVKWNWMGTVTPKKAGYTFDPPTKTYKDLEADLSNEDYIPTEITYTISGKATLKGAGMDGVEINGLPGNPMTGSDGTYSATVPYGWKGLVTPIKEGFKFTPPSKDHAPITSNLTTENFAAEPVTLLITGAIGVPGVVMDGLPGNTVTQQNGSYSVKVEYGWNGVVTPKKAGYQFDPVDREYSNVVLDATNDDYTATVLTYTISGSAGMDGVVMKGLTGDPTTDENGFYSTSVEHGFSGTVKPTKAGYTFEPASTIYTSVNSERTKDYTPTKITLTISGSIRPSLEGVEISGLPGNPITAKDGSYKVTVDYGWTGSATPIKEGYTFKEESKTFAAVTGNLTNQSFTAEQIKFSISGSTGVPGVTITGLPGKAVASAADGSWHGTIPYGWSGKITPTKDGYDFEPASLEYSTVMAPEANQSFIGTLQQRKISGIIKSNKGQPVADATILADNSGGSTITNANGEYELMADYGWTGRITPTKEGYTFNPTNKPYNRVMRDQTNQGFSATVQMFTISNIVQTGGIPIAGVIVAADNGGTTATTDARGRFSVKVPFDWTGNITLTKRGFMFDPASTSYTNVRQNIKQGVPEVKPPEPTPPGPTPPGPTPPGPTPPGPTPGTEITPPGPTPPGPEITPPGPTPDKVGPPLTDTQKAIAKVQEQLAALLAQKAGGAAPAAPASVQPQLEPGQRLVTFPFMDSELTLDVLPELGRQAGIPIIPGVEVSGLVTADIKDTPLDTALEIVLAGTPYVVKKTPTHYLVAVGTMQGAMFSVLAETKTLRLNYITADAALGLLHTNFKPYVQAEPGNPPGTDTYKVVVTAHPTLMNRIVSDLMEIDKAPAHVLLDARIVVMERGDLLNLGIEWGWPRIEAGFFGSDHDGGGDPLLDFGGSWPWGVQMGYAPDATFTNSLRLTLNLLSQNGEATILSKPQVLAQDGKEAQMSVMTEEYYMLQGAQQIGSFYSTTELQQIDSGTTLTITPHIGDNNDITLTISIEVSDSIPRGAVSDLPIVTRRLANNVVRVKDGGTVALAGLTENRTSTDIRRTPGLSKLPLVGSLFKSKNNETAVREIAVFVTAQIMPENQRTMEFNEPAAIQAPVQPVGDDFRDSLRNSLSRRTR
jgi:type II secretory pathway component GspD/PulD (secretin)